MLDLSPKGTNAKGETIFICSACEGKGKGCETCNGAGLVALKIQKDTAAE